MEESIKISAQVLTLLGSIASASIRPQALDPVGRRSIPCDGGTNKNWFVVVTPSRTKRYV
eukprot:scaffold1723_cov144-Skeletonema_menzelii.AAC.4